MRPEFVHLSLHTEYSLLDSVVRIKPLIEAVAEAGMPAVAMADQGNLFGMVKFYRAAQRRGIKPIVGADLLVSTGPEDDNVDRLQLLCMDFEGYRNLSRLIAASYIDGQRDGVPRVHRDWLTASACSGLIALCGGPLGQIGRELLAENAAAAETTLAGYLAVFPERFYLQVQRTGRPGEERHLHAAVSLAAKSGTPLVATNEVRFIRQSDFEAHDARVCIHDGYTLADTKRAKRYSDAQYLRGTDSMAALFADLPEALLNSVEIARRCNLVLKLGEVFLPDYPVPEGMDDKSYLRVEAERGLERRFKQLGITGDGQKPYRDRLDLELDVINGMGFPGYFLIVADFIRWARENDVPVGPGRGSGAGSLVAYALEITGLDPLEFDLLFERFLNPERVSMPDFDIDFCMEGRDRVIDYVAQRYGRKRVSQIITYGRMAAKAVVRDVGRVLGHPYNFVDRIAKLIPFEIGITLEKALRQDDELRDNYEQQEEVRALIDLAMQLEGLVRNAGKHAGGVVISPTDLTDFAPLYCEPGGDALVTQFDKDDIEAVGLVKFDFLGLRTLTIIDWAVKMINAQRGTADDLLNIETIPMDDKVTFAHLRRCETTAVFQLESRGMKDLIKRLEPDRFDDIVALVALFRPGPLQSGMVDDFIDRKHGRSEIEYPHPAVEPILEPTYGVILYQEQVMQIAQVLAGYSLGDADLLRRAMGKKKPEEMAKQRSIFLQGAETAGVPVATASYIFDLMEKFAGYGFNKSHSAAYALLSYQTAYLKAHYPAYFMAAVLSADMDNTDKVEIIYRDAVSIGVKILRPDVNASDYPFTVPERGLVRYGLGAVKGVGRACVEALVEERRANGEFRDLFDLCNRADHQKTNKRVLESLIRSGALDAIGANRATMLADLPIAMQAAEQGARARDAGQVDLFAQPDEGSADVLPTVRRSVPELSERDRLSGEKETLGLYLSGHPVDTYRADIACLANGDMGTLKSHPKPDNAFQSKREVVVAGLVKDIRRRGNRVSITLEDRSGDLEAVLYEDVYNEYRHLVSKDRVLLMEGNLRFQDFLGDWQLTARTIMDVNEAREQHLRRIVLEWPEGGGGPELVAQLQSVLEPYRDGNCAIDVRYRSASARAKLSLGEDWLVRPTETLIRQLEDLLGPEALTPEYPSNPWGRVLH